MSKTILFVYGTLQSGQGNHRVLRSARARYLGVGLTKPEFTLRAAYQGGGFPYLCPGGKTEVHGEVYEIDADGLSLCDRLEGYPHHYDRKEIELAYFAPDGDGPISQSMKALAYIPADRSLARMSDRENPPIASGDWKAFSAREEIEEEDPDDEDAEQDEREARTLEREFLDEGTANEDEELP